MSSGYANVENGAPYRENSSSYWLEQQEKKGRKSKYIVIGSLVALVVLIAAGIAIGVTVSKNHHNSSSSSAIASSSNSTGKTGAVNETNPNDPSSFVKNDALKHSFYGLAYTPEGSQLPACGNSLAAVIEDIQLMSQLTSRIRLYGADCNQSALVLEAIKQTKVNMGVYLGIYNVPTDAGAAYVRQRDTIVDALKTYGTDHVLGITVGNEFMLNYVTNYAGGADVNSAAGNVGAQLLITNITDAKSTFGGLGLSTTPTIGTADAGSYFNTQVLEQVDYGMSNVHPWFANVSIDQAAGWTAEFFQQTNVDVANNLTNKPKMFIAETGWPTKSSDAGNANNGPSLASVDNLQKFMDTFVCQANQNGTGYFYFEYFDETWKDAQFGGVEGWWGLFNADKTLKNVTIPDCHID
ncbi:glycoside hydrolase superfamily [Irpex rosettiformis]|uniref:Glycoside hydrolase superfamily n=1 Tax=Irpex rosettiformis TaxID=378272 RepID=A0ACB8UA31_9APHY|nr:glycoside hydrolase superfamily [Irpex rosettiformis]